MPTAIERLHEQMDELMADKRVAMALSTNSPEGYPHSVPVWFAPSDDLDEVYWYSNPNRDHSRHIDMADRPLVAGSMWVPQERSKPCHSLNFRGEGFVVTDKSKVEKVIGIWLVQGIFTPDEIDKYTNPPKETGLEPHKVYGVRVDRWTIFDGRLPIEERKVDLDWPAAE